VDQLVDGAQETVSVKIRLRDGDAMLVSCVYRSPNSTHGNDDKIREHLRRVSTSSYTHICLMGDFNHPTIDWSSGVGCTTAGMEHTDFKFLESVRDSFLHQHVLQPTHFRGEQRANFLDLVFTNEADMVEGMEYGAPVGKSHHVCLHFLFKCYYEENCNAQQRYIFNKGDYQAIRQSLGEVDWDEALETDSVEEAWQTLKQILMSTADKHIPKKSFKSNGQKPRKPLWMNSGVMAKLKQKRAAFKRYLETREGRDYQEFAKSRNQAKWEVRKAKREFEKKVALQAKTNPKAFYAYANSKLKTRAGVSDLLKPDGTTTETNQEKAEVLNDFFTSVFTQEDTSRIPDFEQREGVGILDNLQVTEKMVADQFNKLKTSKSAGPDGLHARLLREAKDELVKPFTVLFNKSIRKGKLPEDWKQGQITPIFKKGNRASAGNYRPVSLTSIACKMLEGIIRNALLNHMENAFTDCQHGFIGGRSCTTQLLDTVEAWTRLLDEGSTVDVVFLDFAKAFDSVPHQRLLTKLQGYGVKGDILSWIADFLCGRRQRVVVGGAASGWTEVLSGIPQGSVMGPFLFICYVNDMPEAVEGLIRMFADDTKIFNRANTPVERQSLQDDLNRLKKWSEEWQLRFNADKCKVMHLGRGNGSQDYTMESNGTETSLQKTTCEKDLGVHVDPSLKFTKHCETATNKANRILGLVRRSFDYLDAGMLRQLFKGIVRPHLEYGNSVWAPLYKKDIAIVEGVQRRATRMVPELRELEYEDRLRALKLPSLAYRRFRGDLIEVYKYTHGLYNVRSEHILPRCQSNVTRGHPFKLVKQASRLDIRKHFFGLRVVNSWNSLPEKVVNAPSLNSFKNRLDRAMSDHLYSKTLPEITSRLEAPLRSEDPESGPEEAL